MVVAVEVSPVEGPVTVANDVVRIPAKLGPLRQLLVSRLVEELPRLFGDGRLEGGEVAAELFGAHRDDELVALRLNARELLGEQGLEARPGMEGLDASRHEAVSPLAFDALESRPHSCLAKRGELLRARPF